MSPPPVPDTVTDKRTTLAFLPTDVHPTLTKEGYYTSPDIRVLREMTSEELSKIYRFTIFRPNIGAIEWEGLTDVRYLDLDRLVTIEPKMIGVYEGLEHPEKPEIGQGLNKPALVTLFNVFPKSASSPSKSGSFGDKLKKICQKNGSEFRDYLPETGESVT
jgi:nuclear pore complex protein Nup98-Nup96